MFDHRFDRHITVSAFLSLFIGLSVITGWVFNIPAMAPGITGVPAMKFNSAVCFLLSGAALYFLYSGSSKQRLTGRILTGFVLTISAVSLSADIFGYSNGIDEMIIIDSTARNADIEAPGRMASTTALSFIFLSISFFFMWSEKKRIREFTQYLLHTISLITLVAFMGYLYNVPVLYKLSFLSSMSLHTAIFLFILSGGASLVNYSSGITGLLTGKKIGNQIARRLLPLSAFIVIILGFVSIKAFHADLLNLEFGIALFSVSFLVVTILMIAVTANGMNKIDSKRIEANKDLDQLNRNLEQTIIKRTAELKHVSDSLRLAASGGNIGIWEVDLSDGKITGNNIFFNIILGEGKRTPYIRLHKLHELVHPDDRAESRRQFALAESGQENIDSEYRIVKENSIHFIKVKGIVEKDDAGEPRRILGALMDITAQKKAEQQLKEQYNNIRIFVQEAPMQIAMFDTNMCYITASNDWINDHGLAGVDVIGRSHYELFPHMLPGRRELHKRCLAGETIREAAEKINLIDGTPVWLSWVMCPWYIEDDIIGGMMICTYDITQQKEQMEELRLSEERYYSMVNNVEDYAIYSIDIYGYIQNWNRGAELIQGYNSSEAIGEHFSIFFTDKETKRNNPDLLLRQVAKAGNMQNKGWRKRKDGSIFRAMSSITALHNESGEVMGFSEVVHDLTLREAEAEARKYAAILEAKNKEMEQFVYIASHDLQEPLRTVSNFIQIIDEDHKSELTEPVKDYLHAIRQASLRMNALISELLSYSRLGRDRKLGLVDCNDLMANVTDDLAALINETNALVMAPSLPAINGFERELRQLFQNLLINGIKFRKKDVFPEIDISYKEYNDRYQFTIKDNGIGINPKHFEKIFYIFQRLNPQNEFEGNGIGLANCKKNRRIAWRKNLG